MADLRIEEYNVGDIGTNCYFIVNADTKEMVIIDPGGDGADLIRRIKERGLKLQAVAFGVTVYARVKEEATMHDIQKNVSAMFGNPETYDADVYAKGGDVLDLAGFKIKVISTPGHTEGGCCYYFDGNKVLASGDTLFCGSVGRTDFKGGSMSELVRSVKEKLFLLPNDTAVLPGHEARTTIGYEKQYNMYLA